MSKKLTGMGVFVHMAKALIALTQDFANEEATDKVYNIRWSLSRI